MREPVNNNYKLIFQSFLGRLLKPKKTTTKDITVGLKPIKEGVENLRQAITFPAFPSIQALEKPPEGEEDTQYIGPVAEKYRRKFATKSVADTTLLSVVSWLSHTGTNTTFLSKATDYFFHMLFRGERQNYAGKKSRLNRATNSQPPGHQSDTLTTEPSGRDLIQRTGYMIEMVTCYT